MSDDKNPQPLPPFIADGSHDAAAIIARNEEHSERQQAPTQSSAATPEWFPRPHRVPFFDDGLQDAAAINAIHEQHRRRSNAALFTTPFVPTPDEFPVLVTQTVFTLERKTDQGQLIKAATLPLLAIIKKILEDPSRMYGIDPRKWEEIVAAFYKESGLFDEVTLTHRSADDGRDIVAVKNGHWGMRVLESVKRKTPGHEVTAAEVRDLLGALGGDHQATQGVVSTTWEFAPKIKETLQITQYTRHRLELVDGKALVERFREYTVPKSG